LILTYLQGSNGPFANRKRIFHENVDKLIKINNNIREMHFIIIKITILKY
jgi:hypothetical protein